MDAATELDADVELDTEVEPGTEAVLGVETGLDTSAELDVTDGSGDPETLLLPDMTLVEFALEEVSEELPEPVVNGPEAEELGDLVRLAEPRVEFKEPGELEVWLGVTRPVGELAGELELSGGLRDDTTEDGLLLVGPLALGVEPERTVVVALVGELLDVTDPLKYVLTGKLELLDTDAETDADADVDPEADPVASDESEPPVDVAEAG